MDAARRLMAIISMTMFVPALLCWPIVHPFITVWRRVGPLLTYVVVGSLLGCVAFVAFRYRSLLLMTDFGTHLMPVTAGAALNAGLLYWNIRFGMWLPHLNVSQRLGLPELRGVSDPRALMRDGVYGIVRHPVYVGVVLHSAGWALLANYGGVYLLTAATLAVMSLVIAVEERELTDRFGDAYRAYQREVPCVIPRFRRAAAPGPADQRPR